jgi:Holliday junction resolvasome RuvABC endonuclease subunit
MKILAIDPSLTNTACVLGDEHGFEMKCFQSSNAGIGVTSRLFRYQTLVTGISKWLESLAVKDSRWACNYSTFIEGYSFGSNDANARFSAEYGGMLRSSIWKASLAIHEVAPTTLKKFCTGKGAGKKEMVIAHLMKRYDVEFKTNDEFDAYGLYRLGLVAEGLVEAANQAQQEAADTVLGRAVKKPKKKRAPGSVPPRDEVYQMLKANSEQLKTGN